MVSHWRPDNIAPIQLERLKENPVNLISLTPGTSFDLRSSGGVMEERASYIILRKRWGFGNSNKYKRFFQCRVGDNWNNYLKWFHRSIGFSGFGDGFYR